MAQDSSIQERNKALVQASFDNWRSGTGSPFDLLDPNAVWTIVGGMYADGDMVIILFDGAATATDGVPYRNTYTWYFQIRGTKVINAIAFFDTRDFDNFWMRVKAH
jgi:uncharacterized protein